MADPMRIKPDPDAAFAEDELDESADLGFYDPNDFPLKNAYLARLPGYVWQAWASLPDDAEIQIGKVRRIVQDGQPEKLQILLDDLPQHYDIPKEYNLDMVDANVNNTFIFGEHDHPSYAAKNKERAEALAQGIPAHLVRQQMKQSEPPQERGKKGQQYTKKAIPKQTAIAATIKREVVATPLENPETDYALAARGQKQTAPKHTVQVLDRLPPNGITDPKGWETFLRTTEAPSKAKKMDNKTARWPENQLLDELAKCFSVYMYWSIKALRSRIPQPEAFIRECLDKIAVIHRTGTFANHWSLKPEYQSMISDKDLPAPTNEAAPKPEIASEDEDDDDIKMEDVLF
ncbi:Rap30/74 interaction domain-containing protein [Neurospora crassa]|uniref:Transcription initiation factor IIF subunit beta n=1 Tax=Neurospora crassa (strain ATCC 24698 / 74-OR23-1A / CBS 708.71 / DSM 1257 / FGSC 987) TaxID=367110 RepID=Q7SD24_NEUCR|nr:hypothetical protein NCU03047 [Neurospora crassa OR74A]EAA34657.2 hypothetical protein NCU03047 [Neurospora crassa OR74A]KHE79924.1 Rap30/74 interaction domain-containing protein [Neurospora crassa]|eukprot:XP_963893.2 hypothetical protein NCU03047 [Neurospora crassa OR74A]